MLCLCFSGLAISSITFAQVGDLKQLCNNATVANKRMAKQAGYDRSSKLVKTVAPVVVKPEIDSKSASIKDRFVS